MNTAKTIRRLRQLVDQFPDKKRNKDLLSHTLLIKAFVEDLQAEFQKREDKETAKAEKKKIIKKALRQLLVALDKIFERHEEIGDTDVREKMFAAIHFGFIKPKRGYKLPAKFGMFSEPADKLVHAVLQEFLRHPEVLAARKLLKTPEDRMTAFQDDDVETRVSTSFFDYFGYSSKPRVI
ncbi:MAG TPA: hypothetical protein VNT99_13875 [Methylomirabilota bacterium]|nr:hypothetical protein [Methylomirabilota bacterium]